MENDKLMTRNQKIAVLFWACEYAAQDLLTDKGVLHFEMEMPDAQFHVAYEWLLRSDELANLAARLEE